jgi:hypothetical protein
MYRAIVSAHQIRVQVARCRRHAANSPVSA